MSSDEKTANVIEWLEGLDAFERYRWSSVHLDYGYMEILGGGSFAEFVEAFGFGSAVTADGVALTDPDLDEMALDGFVENSIDSLLEWDWEGIENRKLERICDAIVAGSSTKREIRSWLVANDRNRESVRYINQLLYRFEGKWFVRDVAREGAAPTWRVIGQGASAPAKTQWLELDPDVDCPIEIRFDRWERLRGWQREAIRNWAANGNQGLVEAVTGSGKSDVGIAIVEHCVTTGQRVLVLTPGIPIREQWAQRLRDDVGTPLGVAITEISTGTSPEWRSAPVMLAHPTSAANAIKSGALDPATIGCIIGDEAHHLGAAKWRNALSPRVPARLGLSATLERNEGFADVLLPYFGGVVYEYGFGRAYGDGYIAPFRLAYLGCAFSPPEQEEYDEASDRREKAQRVLAKLVPEFRTAQGAEFFTLIAELAASNENSREAIAASKVMKAISDQRSLRASCAAKFDALPNILVVSEVRRRGIVFTQTKAAAQQVGATCAKADVACRVITGETPADERRKVLDAFRAGGLQILVGPQVLNQGLDIPEVDFGVVLAASKSEREMKQRFGRALRLKADGRDAAIVVMYVIGTTEDPDYSDGPRDGFMGELEDFCDPAARTFLADGDLGEAVAFLSDTTRTQRD